MKKHLFAAALLAALPLLPARAQTPAPTASVAPDPAGEVTERRDWALAQLEAAKKRAAGLDEKTLRSEVAKAGLPESYVGELTGFAQDTIKSYQAAADTLNALINNQRILDDLQKQPEPARPTNEKELDALRDRIAAVRQQILTAQNQVRLDDSLLTRSRAALEASEQEYRRIAEETNATTDAGLRARAELQLQLSDFRKAAANAALFLATWRVELDQLEELTSSQYLRRLEKALGSSGLDTVFTKNRAATALSKLAEVRAATQKQIDETRKLVDGLNATLAQIDSELKEAGAAVPPALTTRRLVASEAAGTANRLLQTQEKWLAAIGRYEETWKSASTVAEKESTKKLQDVRQNAEEILADLDPEREQLRMTLQDVQRRLDEVQATALSKDAAMRKLEESRLDLLRRRVDTSRELSAFLDSQMAMLQKMATEARERIAARSWSERLSLFGEKSVDEVKGLWNKELITISNTVGLTVGKIVMATLILILGWVISKRISRTISGNIRRRFSIDPVRSAGIEKVIFVPLIAIIVLSTLNWLSIPLTAFAFLGGALAIGVGFGTQTLVNNFMSGLILLVERRIKVGDIIEVDTHTGTVLSLGTRCSRISKGNGVEVLVPNSYLLEKNVVNWTLSGTRHQFDFTVGFSYGVKPAEVLAILLKATQAEEKILKEPIPRAFFDQYGSNALIFKIVYWVDLKKADNREVGSNIRVRIDQLCREAGLEIVSTRQDVRLSTNGTLPVQLEK